MLAPVTGGASLAIGIGMDLGGVSGYMLGRANGATGLDMAGYIAGGVLVGGLSGGGAVGVSAAGGGAMLAGAAAGAIGGGGFTALNGGTGSEILQGAAFGAIAGLVGGGVGSLIGGGWGALAGGASSNLTNQLLYSDGDFNQVNWGSVGLSGLTSFGIYHEISYSNWKWGGGKNFGDVELTYRAYNKLNALYTRSRFIRRELAGAVLEDGSFARIYATERTETSITINRNHVPDNTRYLIHTHYPAEGWPVSVNGRLYAADPYKPSYPTDYKALQLLGLDEGMILTNKSLLNYNANMDIPYSNNWAYPLLRYIPMYWWFNMGN